MDQRDQTAPEAEAEDLFGRAGPHRLTPLEGGLNFRDLGGYRTHDGRRVRRGKLYRSGSLSGLTEADLGYVAGLGVRTVCDLRTTSERTQEPNLWVETAPIVYWTRDYELSFGEMRRVLNEGPLRPEQARAAMLAAYRHLPFEQAPAYRELFHRLAAGEAPLVFHCSAGKDRAGTAAALILSALGVPYETIVADYLLSDGLSRARHEARERANGGQGPLSQMDPEVVRIVLGAEAAYLDAAFAAIQERRGSLAGYLADELGVGEAKLEEIRSLLLE